MSYTVITKPTVGDPTELETIQTVIDDLDFLNGVGAAVGNTANGTPILINSSFEIDGDLDGKPDNWTETLLAGGNFLMDISAGNFYHGKTAIKITAPGGGGNGGGYIQNNDFYPISPGISYYLRFFTKSSDVTMINKVEIFWFQNNQSASGITPSTIIWSDSTTNPASWTLKAGMATPPSDAAYLQVRLTGGNTGSPAASTWYDGVELFKPVWHNKLVYFSANGSWTVTDDVMSITIDGVGAGGGGSSGAAVNGGGGGGGGAANSIQIDVIPGDVIGITIGVAGAAGTGLGANGGNGGSTIIKKNGTTIYTIPGGAGGVGSSGTGGAGGTAVAYDAAHIIFAVNGTTGTAHSGGVGGAGGASGASTFPTQIRTKGNGGAGGAGGGGNGVAGDAGYSIIHY
jgi:hypothetical protein